MVLGRCSHHCRAADINILDGIFQRAVGFCDGGCEGVEVDHDHVDGGDTVFCHHAVILASATEYAAVHFGVQGFYPAIHHFGETGVVRHLGDLQPGFLQQAIGAAGGEQFYAHLTQRRGEFGDTRFVRDTDQGAIDLYEIMFTHCSIYPSSVRRSGCTA